MTPVRLLLHLMGKEARNVVRDRRSLFIAILLPCLVFPLLVILGGRGMIEVRKAEQLRTLTVAADESARAQWRTLHHEWFLQSDVGRLLRVAGSPLWRALQGSDAESDPVLQEVLRDPDAYERWLRTVMDEVRGALDDPAALAADIDPDMQEMMPSPDSVRTFFETALLGLALIEWVDPADLDTPTAIDENDVVLAERWHDAEGHRLAHAIRTRRIHAAMQVDGDVASTSADRTNQVIVHLLFDSSDSRSTDARQRIDRVVSSSRQTMLSARLVAEGLPWTFVEPVRRAAGGDIATPGRVASMIAAMMVPYLVLIFAFVGGLYPAIELGAGEKERGTLETLLLAPVGRTPLAIGKFLVVCTAAMTSALMGLAALWVTMKLAAPAEMAEHLALQLGATQVLLLVVLVLPPAMASAGMLLAVSLSARSFREAQNLLAPIQLLFILPAMVSTFPGIDLTPRLAAIPIINVALAARDVIRGTWDPAMIGITILSCAIFAAICVGLCVRQFHRESVLFRL